MTEDCGLLRRVSEPAWHAAPCVVTNKQKERNTERKETGRQDNTDEEIVIMMFQKKTNHAQTNRK